MAVTLLRIAALCFLGRAYANYCTQNLWGTCMSLFTGRNGGCPVGFSYTYNFCGSLQMCCFWPQHTSGSQTAAPAGVYPTHPPATLYPHYTASPPGGGSHTGTGVQTGTGSSRLGSCGVRAFGSTSHKMVGGSMAYQGQFPWQVSLQYNGALGKQHLCGGTLIDSQWVLTASHCFQQVGANPQDWLVGLGLQNQKSAPTRNFVHVSAIYKHELFRFDPPMINDIALMKLSKPVDTSGSYVKTACLPSPGETFDSEVCQLSGWGTHVYAPDAAPGTNPVSEQLEYLNLQTMSNSLCQYYMGYKSVKPENICAGATLSTGGHGPCQGDSGGPLACKKGQTWSIAGVVSWGYGCAEPNKPGIYTRVTSYLDWIHNKMAFH